MFVVAAPLPHVRGYATADSLVSCALHKQSYFSVVQGSCCTTEM
jgi:hypothetical protein